MKILSISHTAIIKQYRLRYYYLAKNHNIELSVLVPQKWYHSNKLMKFEPDYEHDRFYDIKVIQPIIPLPFKQNLRNVTHFYPSLIKIIRDFNPDIVISWSETYFFLSFWVNYLCKKYNQNIKTILFAAQNIFKDFTFPFNMIEKYNLNNSDGIFYINSDAAQVLNKKGYKNKKYKFDFGIEYSIFNTNVNANISFQNNKLTLGFVGKLCYQKGVMDLIELFKSEFPKYNIIIVGSGEYYTKLKSLTENKKYSQQIKIYQALPYDKIPNMIKSMDILILPSRTLKNIKEQFGRVLIEAMALGVPVICSNSGNMYEVVEDAGLIFREGNIKDLKQKIKVLEDSETYNEYAQKGIQLVQKRYTWEKIAEKNYQIFQDILNEK